MTLKKQKPETSVPNIYNKLEAHFKHDKEKFKKIIAEANEVYDFSQNGKITEKLKSNKLNRDSHTKTRNYYNWVAIFHFIFDVPLDAFDLPKKSNFYKRIKPLQKNYVELHQLKEFEARDNRKEEIKQEYYKASKKFLDFLDTRLFVYDYLERHSNELSPKKKKYIKVHDDIFATIEKRLKKDVNEGMNSFKYARFLVLPKGIFKKTHDVEISKKEIARIVIDRCSLPLFKHICRSLRDFKDFEKNDINHDSYEHYYGGFYLTPFPTRAYHYASVNKGKFILTEYYRYNRSGKCKPDLLFIEDNKGKLSELANIYEEEFQKLLTTMQDKLKLKDIFNIMHEYIKEIKKMKKDAKKLMLERQKASDDGEDFKESKEIELVKLRTRSNVMNKKLSFYKSTFNTKLETEPNT